MRERGDCHCLHEPFIHYYYLHLGRRPLRHFDAVPDQPRTFAGIMDWIDRESRQQTVFVKDMAYYVLPEFLQHPELAGYFRHAFLIRDPYRALMSYYRLDPAFQMEEAGLEAQWRLFHWIADRVGKEPPVIHAKDMQRNPRGVVGALWQCLGLDPVDEAFSWQPEVIPPEWAQVAVWHERTARYSRIVPDRRSDVQVRQAFAQLVKKAPQLQSYLDHHWPFYLELSSRSLLPWMGDLRSVSGQEHEPEGQQAQNTKSYDQRND